MKRHIPFQPHLIWSAIFLGLLGGFGLGAHLVYFLAFGLPPGKSFAAMIQVHGHLQLVGWTGFFIIGVSLYKLPRLMSSPPLKQGSCYFIYFSLIAGLILRSVAQIVIFYIEQEFALRAAVMIGSLLESAGMLVYFFILFKNSLTFSCQTGSYSAASIKPFLIVSLLGWFAYAIINAMLGIQFFFSTGLIMSSGWDNLAIETYIHLVLIPTCFAFSISTFPIFLRLRAPTWPVVKVAVLYSIGSIIYLASVLSQQISLLSIEPQVRILGVCIKSIAIFWLLVELDLFRRIKPWFTKFRDNQDRENRPPRRNAGDYGQFGNFEWLIYAAYTWLAIAVLSEFAGLWFRFSPSPSIVRHFYLLGFVTHLILGMGVRIVPGFLGKNRIAFPNLVRLSLFLILLATLGRTLPIIFSLLNFTLARFLFGFSGVFAMLAIACLGVNLLATVRQSKRSVHE